MLFIKGASVFWEKWFRKEPPVTTEKKLIKQFRELDTRFLENTFSSDMSFFSIDSVKTTIVEYTDLLLLLAEKLEYHRSIGSFLVADKPQSVLFRNFFLDKTKKYFLNPQESFQNFVSSIDHFLECYEKIDLDINRSDLDLKNMSMVSLIISNLSSILKELQSESQRNVDSLQRRDKDRNAR